MLPLPVVEPEVKPNKIESPQSAVSDEPPKKRQRSSGSATAKGRTEYQERLILLKLFYNSCNVCFCV